jgi:hypothetical protein
LAHVAEYGQGAGKQYEELQKWLKGQLLDHRVVPTSQVSG